MKKSQFTAAAKSIIITVNGQSFTVSPKEFSTGSVGFNLNDKLVITVGGESFQCQLGTNITVIGSKECPADGDLSAAQADKKAKGKAAAEKAKNTSALDDAHCL